MLVKSISLGNYRNYRELQIGFHPNLNIFVGGNGQGKTNILEAVFYAATGKSHRTNYDGELISWDNKFLRIVLKGERSSGNVNIEMLVRADGKKILKVNNQLKKKLSELIGTINVVLFSPEDMLLVKGGPSIRRRFLDIEISQTSPFYCHNLANYNRVVTQRNNLLKAVREQKEKIELMDVWDLQLVEFGVNIIKKRTEVLDKISPIARSIHKKITEGAEELNLAYVPSVDIQKAEEGSTPQEYFMSKLKEIRNTEII
ncbi:MAG: DNA replication/repair protein RecF, partial [Eubacteriales bacterium]